MDWPSYFWGLATIPAAAIGIAALTLTLGVVFARDERGVTCDDCDWKFAGQAQISKAMRHTWEPRPRAPRYLHARASALWHDQVVMRGAAHRRAWTTRFESYSPSSALRQSMLPWAKRNGVKGHVHTSDERGAAV